MWVTQFRQKKVVVSATRHSTHIKKVSLMKGFFGIAKILVTWLSIGLSMNPFGSISRIVLPCWKLEEQTSFFQITLLGGQTMSGYPLIVDPMHTFQNY